VDDFHQVDYDRIHTLNVSVTQELARSLDAQGEDNTALKNDSSALKRKVDALDARVRTLEATIAH
jgi:Trk K+ transport system NAD-binding subunit